MTCAGARAPHWPFAVFFVALTAAGCLSGDVASIPPEIARFAVGVGLGACAAAWVHATPRRPRSLFGAVLAAAGVVGAIAGPWPALRLAAVAVWAGGTALLLASREKRCHLAGAMCAPLALLLLDVVPALRLLAVEGSAGLSRILLAPFGGGSFSGSSGGLVGLLALCIALWSIPRRGAKLRWKAATFLGLVVIFVAHLFVERQISSVTARMICSGTAFLLGALVVAGWAGLSPRGGSGEASHRAIDTLLAGLAALCFLLPISLAAAEGLRDAAQPAKRVLLFDVSMLADHRTPADKPLGQAFTGASFGSLPLYLRAYGHECAVAATIDAELGARADVVVVINPGRPFSPDEREILLAFVRGGGGLLALADHTDIGGLMVAFNDLLAPTGLRLRFDSAVSARHDWHGSLVVSYPEAVAFRDAHVPVSVGASVSGAPWSSGSRPLLLGRDAFSDPGDRTSAGAFLGNLTFDPAEDYGDIVLAVERPLGLGRIALFGDTSIFQNLALASSSGYVDRLVRSLGSRGSVWPFLPLAAAVLGVALLPICARRPRGWGVLVFVALIAAAGIAAADLALARGGAVGVPRQGAVGFIDVAHANLVDREALATLGIDALAACVARAGALPVVWDHAGVPAALGEGNLWISVAATRAYSASEVRALGAAAEQGAGLVVGARWPYSAAIAPLVAPLGLEVTNVPLGAVRPVVEGFDEAPEFKSAWVLRTDDTWTAFASAVVGEGSFPVASERKLGRGWIAVVADTGVFTNEALEGRGYAFVENVRFVERLLRGEASP